MPFAAFGLKKYRSGTSPVSISPDKIDPLARLGDSEVAAVKHTPAQTIPELGQRSEDDSEISSSMRTEESRNVFENKNSGAAFSNQSRKLIKESRLSPAESVAFAHARERNVLAREAGDPDGGRRNICTLQ